jgi:hypothetical protein
MEGEGSTEGEGSRGWGVREEHFNTEENGSIGRIGARKRMRV